MVDLLLSHRADVNAANRICFVFAAKRHSQKFVQKLLAPRPNFSMMMPLLISSDIDQGLLLQLLESAFSQGGTSDDVNSTHPSRLILTIQKYPRSESHIKMLLRHGCDPKASVSAMVEKATPSTATTNCPWFSPVAVSTSSCPHEAVE
jgi:hypothetical protein